MCHKKGTFKFSHWSGGCSLKMGLIRDPKDFRPVLKRGWRETGNSFFRCGALCEHSMCLQTGGLERRSNSISSPALLHHRCTSQGLTGRREYFCMSPGLLASLECHHNITGSVKDTKGSSPPSPTGMLYKAQGSRSVPLKQPRGLLPVTCPPGEPGTHQWLGMHPRWWDITLRILLNGNEQKQQNQFEKIVHIPRGINTSRTGLSKALLSHLLTS